MALSQRNAQRLGGGAHDTLHHVDSVYFLPFPDWEKELRSNRWHYATRWARLKPVIMLNPVLAGGSARSVGISGMPNLRVLRIRSLTQRKLLAARQIQLGQVLLDIAEHGFSAPLLWAYNPDLSHVFAAVPAVARVYHATEAFFDMPRVAPRFVRRLSAMIGISDVTVAVSDGVADGVRRHVQGAEVVTVTNGCDYRHYSDRKPDAELTSRGHGFERVAVYAGNVNDRLDFGLLNRLADEHHEVLFAAYGPVGPLTDGDARQWHAFVRRPNVTATGAVDPDRLRDIYAAADIGLIPYRQDPWLVENGLPLKALEMAATGLPVVSSLMNSLRGFAKALVVTSTSDEFLSAFERTGRSRLTAAESRELFAVSSANDYDVKFGQALAAIESHVDSSRAITRVDRLIELLGPDWIDDEQRFARWLGMSAQNRMLEWSLSSAARLVPASVKRRIIPDRLRAATQELRGS